MRLLSQPRTAPPHVNPTHPIETYGRPIILIGLMGCGKTTVGKLISKRTGMPLLDMDSVIEEQVGKGIPEIFAQEGEEHFRTLETALLQYLVDKPSGMPAVISTGGGVVKRPENCKLLRRLGYVVWLNVSVKMLLHRTARANNRPLLQTEDREATLRRLLDQRRYLYATTAHLRMNTTHVEVGEVCRRVCNAAEKYFARHH